MTTCHSYIAALILMALMTGCANGIALFNGDDLTGWEVIGDADWQVRGGELFASGEGDGFLATTAEYRDFHLALEFWVDGTTNSGVFIRCQERGNIHPDTCFELNIFDAHPRQEARTGAIVFKVMPPLVKVDTVGRWNTYDVLAQGSKLVVRVNDRITAIMDRADPAGGFIALQHWQTGTVRFRGIRLREL